MAERYINSSIKEYLDDLASKKPAPGGGSVGALAASLAAGLVSMVVNFSLGKDSPHEKQLKEILMKSEEIREKSGELIDEDIKVYSELSDVFKLSKEDSHRKEKVQQALKKAASVPLAIARSGLEIMQLNKELLSICNERLISDIGVSVSIAFSAVEIGALNVKINLSSIKDKQFNKIYKEDLDHLKKNSCQIKSEIYPQVENKITK